MIPSGVRSSSGTLIPFSAGRLNASAEHGDERDDRRPEDREAAQPLAAEQRHDDDRGHERDEAAARVRHAEARQQDEQRAGSPRSAWPACARRPS